MRSRRLVTGLAALLALAAGVAQASVIKGRGDAFAGRAEADAAGFFRVATRARLPYPAAKPAPGGTRATVPPSGTRATKPVITAAGPGAEQAGYVHYFIISMPDESLEIQVGIELPGERIAWSFPGLGVTVSPFLEYGVVQAAGKDYEVWHLYGIRPFPEDAAMAALRKNLLNRIDPWIRAGTPYCEHDGPKSACMSCLGFVLRALFPGRASDYPDLPRDFWRAGSASSYTTRDLLLYLTGMLDLPTREARLQRIARLELPLELREDLEELVYALGAFESATTARSAVQNAPATRAPKVSIRPGLRRPL